MIKSKIIKKKDNNKIYSGLLSSDEIAQANKMLEKLVDLIPGIESKIENEYSKGIEKKYYLGKALEELLVKEQIPPRERIFFWQEIDSFTENDQKAFRGSNRHNYEMCYRISQYPFDVACKLNFRTWQSFLDRINLWDDDRFIYWLARSNKHKKNMYVREFGMMLDYIKKEKDTIVYSHSEINDLYELIWSFVVGYYNLIDKYFCKEGIPKKLRGGIKREKAKKIYFKQALPLFKHPFDQHNAILNLEDIFKDVYRVSKMKFN